MPGFPVNGVDSPHLQIEAMKLALAEVYRLMVEPSSMTVTPAQMVEASTLATRAKLANMKKVQNFGADQFMRRAGIPEVKGRVGAGDARRDGQAAGF